MIPTLLLLILLLLTLSQVILFRQKCNFSSELKLNYTAEPNEFSGIFLCFNRKDAPERHAFCLFLVSFARRFPAPLPCVVPV